VISGSALPNASSMIGDTDAMDWLKWMSDHLTWEGVMAAVALLLSMWALYRSRKSRLQADVHAYFVTLHRGEKSEQMLMVGNRGPADAENIGVSFTRGDKPWEPRWPGSESPFPLPVLAPGAVIPLACWGNWTEGKSGLVVACLSWQDGRRGTRSKRTTLSMTGLPMGGGGGMTINQIDRELGRGLR
jgi:hypothetical protein